ncbi:MAG TPA: hypothetical protein VFW98_01280 [Gemmatimonadaceae bacterium]|nr:hypothetical protein [Gemmatimonadaceae bacterium]
MRGWEYRCTTAAFCAVVISAISALGSAASAQSQPDEALAPDQRLKVFVDCQGYRCDMDYFRTEIHFVAYTRDPREADVHVLLTTQRTAAGGRDFTLAFLGLGTHAVHNDTLHAVSEPGESPDAVRAMLTRTIKLGLIPYLVHSRIARGLRISYSGTPAAVLAAPAHDPWNHWVFELRASGSLDGEQSQHSTRLSGSVSANRTTAAWKLDGSLHADFRADRFALDSGTLTSISRSREASGLVVKSVDGHWSIGLSASAASSDFLNQRLALQLAPALEWDVFPYADATRRQFAIMYRVGARHFVYQDTTIYNKTVETVPRQSLVASLAQNQPWGTINVALLLSNDPAHPSISRQRISADLGLRIAEGLSLDLSGHASRIRDQLYLPKQTASEEEVLLQRRQLATSYDYRLEVGLSYSFGSILNSVVNPRFEENLDIID